MIQTYMDIRTYKPANLQTWEVELHSLVAPLGPLSFSWGPLGGILEGSWTLPGSLGGVLGRLGSVLEFLGCSWKSLEASGTVQERSKSSPERSRRRSQRLQDASKTASDGFQGVLGTFWNRFGSIC